MQEFELNWIIEFRVINFTEDVHENNNNMLILDALNNKKAIEKITNY